MFWWPAQIGHCDDTADHRNDPDLREYIGKWKIEDDHVLKKALWVEELERPRGHGHRRFTEIMYLIPFSPIDMEKKRISRDTCTGRKLYDRQWRAFSTAADIHMSLVATWPPSDVQ